MEDTTTTLTQATITSFSDWCHACHTQLTHDFKNSKGKERQKAGIMRGYVEQLKSIIFKGANSSYYKYYMDPYTRRPGFDTLCFDLHSFSKIMEATAQDIAPGYYRDFGWVFQDIEPLFGAETDCYKWYLENKAAILNSLPEEWR